MKNKVFFSLLLLGGLVLSGCSTQGAVGPAGPQGEQGIPGEVGPAGPQGDKGEQGEPGANGQDGAPGKDGVDGQDGKPGDKGDKGDVGPQGDKGDPGDKGETGPQGPQGEPGQDGKPGDKGDKGDVGPQGPAGPQGDQGDTGPQGPIGPQGPQGEPGKDGQDGKPGDKGDKGDQGEVGPAGPQGDKGDKGDQGLPGKDGQDGAPGKDGQDGKPGVDGQDGAPGKDGADGIDGKSTYESYVEKYGYQGTEDDFLYDFAHHHLGQKATYTINIVEYMSTRNSVSSGDNPVVHEVVADRTYKNGEKINFTPRDAIGETYFVTAYDGNIRKLAASLDRDCPDEIDMFDINNYRAYKDTTIALVYCDYELEISVDGISDNDVLKGQDFKLNFKIGPKGVFGFHKELTKEELKTIKYLPSEYEENRKCFEYDPNTQTIKTIAPCNNEYVYFDFVYKNIFGHIYIQFVNGPSNPTNFYFDWTTKQSLMNIKLFDNVSINLIEANEDFSKETIQTFDYNSEYYFDYKYHNNLIVNDKAVNEGEDILLVYRNDVLVAQTPIKVSKTVAAPVYQTFKFSLDSYLSNIIEPNINLTYHLFNKMSDSDVSDEKIVNVTRNGVDITNTLDTYITLDTVNNKIKFKTEGSYRIVFANKDETEYSFEKKITVSNSTKVCTTSLEYIEYTGTYSDRVKDYKVFTCDYDIETNTISNKTEVIDINSITGKWVVVEFTTQENFKIEKVRISDEFNRFFKEVDKNIFILDIKECPSRLMLNVSVSVDAERAKIAFNSNCIEYEFGELYYVEPTGETTRFFHGDPDIYSGGTLLMEIYPKQGIILESVTCDKSTQITLVRENTYEIKITQGGINTINLNFKNNNQVATIKYNVPEDVVVSLTLSNSSNKALITSGTSISVGQEIDMFITPTPFVKITSIKVNGEEKLGYTTLKIETASEYNIVITTESSGIVKRTVVFTNPGIRGNVNDFYFKVYTNNPQTGEKITTDGIYDEASNTLTINIPDYAETVTLETFNPKTYMNLIAQDIQLQKGVNTINDPIEWYTK